VAKLLLEKGAEVEYKSNNGRTPLWWAAEKGREAVVKLLLEKGADVQSKDRYYGHTPLSWGRRGRTRGGCEAVAREGRRETSTLENAEKALLITLSSFRIFTFFTIWFHHMVISKDHMLVTPS
jgi:Ankyrin repeats (3 copies)